MIRTALLCVPQMNEDALNAVRARLRRVGGVLIVEEQAVASQRTWIAETLRMLCDEAEMDLVLTLGGTLPAPGPGAGEIVPEATLDVVDRLAPALPEAMRAEAHTISPLALLDRGVAGIRSRTLIINLPEGAAAALWLDAIAHVIPGYVAHLQGADDAPRPGDLAAHEEPTDESEDTPGRSTKALNPDEFAAFLRRSKE